MKRQDLERKYQEVRHALDEEIAAHCRRRTNRGLRLAGVSCQTATLIDLYQTLNQLAEDVGPEFVTAVALRQKDVQPAAGSP